jgi:superfamily II DNA/RNA helicase
VYMCAFFKFGVPSSRDTYIHRLGRTGRAGKEGKGWSILSSFESKFLEELMELVVPENY